MNDEPMRTRFGDVLFDADARVVLRGGTRVPLSPKAFRLLEILVSKRPNAVSKGDLQEALWPSTFVSEVNLTVLMAEVRKAIGDGARGGRLIRTVHGFGYAMDVVTAEPEVRSGAGCSVVFEEQELPLRDGQNVLGRDADCAVRIDRPSVSRHHAKIVVTNDDVVLEDLGSKNGTFLRGEPLAGASALSSGDVIGLGSVTLRFVRLGPLPSTRTEVRSGGG
jgi:DNA-binding winged helix-turn-helix (wHTH) protein